MLKKLVIICAALIMAVLPAAAQPVSVSDLQQQQLIELIKAVNNGAERQDASPIANNMPRRLYQEMAAQMKTGEQALRLKLQKSIEAQFAQLKPGGYRLESDNIVYKQGKNGMVYALVPTRIDTDKELIESLTLAVYDNAAWHLIYGGQQTVQNPIFAKIYPDLAEIAVPPAKIEAK